MVEIIAEASKNWLTKENITIPEALKNAKKLAWVAKNCGADVVKFQCHVAEDELKKRHTKRHSWIKLNETLTPFGFWEELKKYCDEIEIEFLVTPMSKLAAIKVNPLVKRWKVASPDIRDSELLGYLDSTDKEVIYSTGMVSEDDMWSPMHYLTKYKMLLCVSEYPLPIERSNLKRLRKGWYDGYSDHTLSLLTGALAVACGASIIEKHFTYRGWGKDATVSLNPDRLKTYIENIREAEKSLLPVQRPTEIEAELLKDFWV